MKLDQHYVDPRLVELYDSENPRGIDTEFYIKLAEDLKPKVIIDLGCGTGLLARELASAERQVIGVDPSPAMLAYARRQPGANKVQWLEGDSSALGNRDADLVVMTGNVAQIFLEDSEWDTTLRDIHSALKVGGHLAFESRNPDDKAWERWNRENTWQRTATPYGFITSWLEVVHVGRSKVSFQGHNIFENSGEDLVAASELRFRSQAEIVNSLNKAGFAVEHVYGGWEHQPVDPDSRVMVFIASRN
jgi:SAM-dependent methyltransferase